MHEPRAHLDVATTPRTTAGRPGVPDELPQLCSRLAEIGVKLDRLEDALHDLTQVLARAVGPPWDITGN